MASAAAAQEAEIAAKKANDLAKEGLTEEAAAAAALAKKKADRAKKVLAFSVEVQLRNILLAEKIWFHRGKTWIKKLVFLQLKKLQMFCRKIR